MIEVRREHREAFSEGALTVLCMSALQVQEVYNYRKTLGLSGSIYADYEALHTAFTNYGSMWAIGRHTTNHNLKRGDAFGVPFKDFVKATEPKQLTDLLHTKKVTIDVVPCHICKKEHPVDSEEYFTVFGDVNVGNTGGIIGGNFDKDLNLFRSQSFCRSCLIEFLQEVK